MIAQLHPTPAARSIFANSAHFLPPVHQKTARLIRPAPFDSLIILHQSVTQTPLPVLHPSCILHPAILHLPNTLLNRISTLGVEGPTSSILCLLLCVVCPSMSLPYLTSSTMCLGGHSSQDLRQHMKEEWNNSPTNNQQGGTDIYLLHILGSSGKGVRTVIIFIVMVLLLS